MEQAFAEPEAEIGRARRYGPLADSAQSSAKAFFSHPNPNLWPASLPAEYSRF